MSPTPRTPPHKPTRDRKPPATRPARRTRAEFESFAEITSAAIFLTQDRRILYANPAAAQSTGYSQAELLGLELWQIAHPNYQPALKQLGETQAWVEHLPSRYEIKIVTKGGAERWLDVTVGSIQHKGKRITAITAFDITERDEAERALRTAHAELEVRVQERTAALASANEKLNFVLNSIAEAYLVLDRDWRFLVVNSVAERQIFGRPASELIGKVLWDEYPQTVGREVYRQYQLAVETNQSVHFEAPSQIVPGHWFEVHAYPHGGVLEAYFRDITERKQAEEEIASLAKFPSENPNPVLRLSQAGNVLYANAASQTLLQAWANTTGDVTLAYWRNLSAEAVACRANRLVDVECNKRIYSFFVVPIAEAGYVNLYGQDITERKRVEEALRQSQERYRRLIENVNDLVCEVDAQARYQFLNSQYEQVLGYTPAELLGHYVREFIHPDDLSRSTPSFKRLVEAGSVSRNEWRFKHKNGEWRWFDCAAQAYEKSPGELRVVVISRDVTERKKKEVELYKLNRALKALSDSNQAMMRAADEARYLEEVCKIVVKDCGHPMVWIGFAEQDEGRSVRPVAYAGFEAGYLEALKVTWADTERGRGPTGTAIRTRKPSGCSNMLTDPNFAPWRAEATKRGYASSIALPLKTADQAFGAITIYAPNPHSFSAEEIELLTELADDLAQGIVTLRLRADRARAEEALRLSEERYRALFTSMNEGFALHAIICDEQGAPCDYRFLEINPAFERLTGLKREAVIGKTYHELLPNDDPRWIKLYGEVALTGQPIQFENYSPVLDRHYAVFAYRPAPQQFAVLFMDVTERKRMDEALRCAHDELEVRVQERTRELAQLNEDLRLEAIERERVESQLRLQMAAVRAAANGIVITDRLGCIQWCNPAFTQITGYEAEEVLGQSLRLLNSGHQSADFYRQLWTTILAGEVWRGELTNRRKDGRLYSEEQTIAPVLDEQREITHFIAIKRDITARKQAEERLARYNQELLALSKAERDQRQLAETLSAANLALTQSLKLETVLETLLEYVARLVPYDSANVMLLEAESRLAVRVTRGYERWQGAELVRAITFDVQAAPVLKALLTDRRSRLVSDTHREPGWLAPPGVEHVRSWLGVPLMAGGNVIGIYSLDKSEPGFFTAEHVHLAEMLVGQAAVAIQNAWLFEQVRAGRERLQSLSRRLVEVQEAERHYVARELHDEAGQALTSLLFGLSQLEQQLNDPGQSERVVELKQMTNDVLESLHRLAMDLRPASLDHLGLVPALLQHVKAIGARYELIAQFKAMGFEDERLSSDVETALYRIVQEALTNIVRHAQATRADVLLERRGDRVVVVVEDNGLGFDVDVARFAQAGHLGLVGIQERAEMLGGSLVIESTANAGTTVVVEVPYGSSNFDRG
ncbi:Signal transduction histidine-protein kinase/phosphatase DegS [Thermoflexales bacterium]|nr:Signal transduction histidine-protein kinase/phosphatase DegS [Thermoflexales bacterium]